MHYHCQNHINPRTFDLTQVTLMASRRCNCISKGCKGKSIRPSEFSRHMRQDEEFRRQTARHSHPIGEDGLVQQVFQMALKGQTSTSDSKWGDAIWERDSRNPARVLGVNPDAVSPSSIPDKPSSPSQGTSATEAPSEQSSHARALYDMLLALDHEMDQHVDNIAAIIAQVVPTTSDKPLQMEERWFRDTLHNIYVANPGRDRAANLLREAMMDRVLSQLKLIEMERARKEPVASTIPTGVVFDTGEQSRFNVICIFTEAYSNR